MRTSPTTGGHPLVFLVLRSGRNRILKMLRRLREPRYLLGFGAGLAYFGWMIWVMAADSDVAEASAEFLPVLGVAVPPLLALFTISWWVAGTSHRSLAFNPAETEILFSGPLSRRMLLRYKLAKTQPGVVVFALFASIFAINMSPLPFLLLLPTLWILLTTFHLHQLAAALIRTSWTQQGRAGLRRNRVPLTLFLLGAAAFLWPVARIFAALKTASSGQEFLWAAERALGQPSAALVLLPFHIMVAPLASGGVLEWAGAVPGALCFLALHYLWVMRTGVAFEEVAAEAGVEVQALMKAMRRGQLTTFRPGKKAKLPPPWFRLRPSGHPAVAIFWKNLTAFTRMLGPSTAAIGLIFVSVYVALFFLAGDPEEAATVATTIPATLAAMTLLMGPIYIRNDLRTDLTQLEVVRTYPLAGRHMVFAGVAAAAVSLAMVQAGMLLFSLLFCYSIPQVAAWWWVPPLAYAVLVLLLLLLDAVAVAVHNILAVNFPAWIPLGPEAGAGIDAMGSQMVLMLLTLALTGLALLFPLTVAVYLALKLWFVLGLWVAVPAALGALLTMVAEVVLTAVLLGDAYEALDPAEAGLLK